MAGLFGVSKCSGHDATKLGNVGHVNAPYCWV